VCPFVQAHLAMVCTPIRIWPSEPWCGEHVLEGGRGLGCEGQSVLTREGVRRECVLEIVRMFTPAVGVMMRWFVRVNVKACVCTRMGDVWWRCEVCP